MRKNIDVYIYIYTKNSDKVFLGRVLLQLTMNSCQSGFFAGNHMSTHMALMEWSSFFKFMSWTK